MEFQNLNFNRQAPALVAGRNLQVNLGIYRRPRPTASSAGDVPLSYFAVTDVRTRRDAGRGRRTNFTVPRPELIGVAEDRLPGA